MLFRPAQHTLSLQSPEMDTRDPGHAAFPADLPERIEGDCAWLAADMADNRRWCQPLTAAEVAELQAASQPWMPAERNLADITAAQFPLPTLGPRMAAVRHELLRGRGFVLLRGLPVQDWGLRQSAVAFFGLGAHLGAARSQNAQGHVLGHVRDLGLDASDPRVRLYQTHERQTFHTDSADIVGLLCLQTARSGGLSALVSSVSIYNQMRQHRPDLAAVLFAPVATDRRGEVPAGCKPWFEIPVFNWYESHFSAVYQRQYVDSAQRFADAPRLLPQQLEALDLLDQLANDPRLNLHMALQRGDLQFVHNHTLLHDRTAFEDDADPAKARHLLRLWLAPHDAQPLPPIFAQRYGTVQPGVRGGVTVAETTLCAPLGV